MASIAMCHRKQRETAKSNSSLRGTAVLWDCT